MLFGYEVADNKKPFSGYVRIKNVDRGVYADDGQKLALIKKDSFLTTAKDVFIGEGKIGIAVHTYDQQTHTTNKNGVFRMKMQIDGQTYFQWTVDKLPFDEGRYVNALMDYKDKKASSLSMHQCHILPTNRLSIYEASIDDGYLYVDANEKKEVWITIYDFENNKTYIKLNINGTSKTDVAIEKDFWSPHQNQSIVKPDFQAHFPSGIFYDKIALNYAKDTTVSKYDFSDRHQLHNKIVPLHKYVVIEIKPNKPILKKDKVVIYERMVEGGSSYLNAYWNGEYVSSKTRSLGTYSIRLDTIAPDIKLLNYSKQNKSFRGNVIRIHGKDEISGIKKCQAFINGKWVLLVYDAKRNLFIYNFDEHCPSGDHELVVRAEDKVGNIFEETFQFKN